MMKCHYEVLQIELDSTDEDIRKSYRKLALKWHPDKNLNNSEEAKEQFQLIQQAYEVLSDPQERAWYDRRRDSILKGGKGSDYEDECVNVYQYFNTTCFQGFGDDEKGFYAVYSEVFNKICAEDSEYNVDLDSDFEIPVFGNSKSPYEEVVHPFYSYWQSYSTKKTYSWLDKYDIRDATNRRILRLMEKENKKIRDKARKERNEEVRALVAFVRRRDGRVKQYSLYLESKAAENEKKIHELRKKQIMKRKEEMSEYVECDWVKFSNLEDELKEIEKSLTVQYDDAQSEDGSRDIPHCLACNKLFKTDQAFLNHEKSKKHKENLEQLSIIMQEDDAKHLDSMSNESPSNWVECDEPNSRSHVEGSEDEYFKKPRKKKKKKKVSAVTNGAESDSSVCHEENQPISIINSSDKEEHWNQKKSKGKLENKKKKKTLRTVTIINNVSDNTKLLKKPLEHQLECVVCHSQFASKNELFKHLRSSNHAVHLTGEKSLGNVNSRKK